MSVALFAPYNWVHEDGVSIAGGNWGPSPDTLLSALLNTDTLHKARSIGTTLAATKYTVDLGQTRRMDTAWVGYHNGTKAAKVRLTFTGAPPAFDHDFTSGVLPAGWTFQRAAIATFEDAAGIISFAGNDVPRWDRRGGVLRGLLMEEARRNLIAHYADGAEWGPQFDTTIDPNNDTAPDNSLTFTKLTQAPAGAGSTFQGIAFPLAETPGNSKRTTFSFYIEAAGNPWIVSRPYSGANNRWVYFDLQNGVVGNADAGAVGRITAFGGGVYRCEVTFTTHSNAATANASLWMAQGNGSNPNPTFVGDGASSVKIWGVQWEEGEFASSVIPTNGSAVTRPIDQLYIDTLLLPWWSALPITAHVRARRPRNKPSNHFGSGNFSPALTIWNAASHAAVELGFSPEYGGAGTSMKAFAGYFGGAALGGDDIAEDTSVSIAAAFQTGASAMSVDGDPVTTAATTFGAAPATRIWIGGAGAGDRAIDGWIQRVSFWTARLADAKLLAGTLDHADFSGVEHQTSWLDIVPTTQAPVGGFLPFGRVAADGKLPDDERDPRGASMLIQLGLDVDAQAVVVEFDDTLNPAGHFEHSILVLAKSAHWQTSIENGFTPGAINDTRAERDGAGGFWGRQMWRRRTIEMVLPWQHVDRALAETLEQQLRLGNVLPCLFAAQIHGGIHDPRLVYYGRLLGPSRVQQVRHVRYGAAFNIEEL